MATTRKDSGAPAAGWWKRLLDFISPRQCCVCGRRLAVTEQCLCAGCLLHLPRTTYQFTPDDNPMVQLFWKHTPIRRAAALIFYEPQAEVARMVYDLKYHDRPDIGEAMGRLMATEMQMGRFFDGIDLLVPVPLTRRRRRQRGYNQSEMLARGVSEVTDIPVDTTVLCRHHFRQSQTLTRSHQERRENVADQFRLQGDGAAQRGRHVLLIDDVCTTGATLSACAEALRDVYGLRISVLTLGFTKT